MTNPNAGLVLASSLFVLVSLGSLGCHRDRKEIIARSPETVDAAPFVAETSPSAPEKLEPIPLARTVAVAMSKRDLKALAAMAHPEKGVRFSPYAWVDASSDVVLSPAQIEDGFADHTVRTFGAYDGSGDPIQLTFEQYFDRFVYDGDFAGTKDAAVDKSIGGGNTVNNASKAYPGATIVELHIGGTNPKYEGMDWRSLRLVFERDGDRVWLVGIIHDEWTI